ncbi:uncharacterized protein LOC110456355 [Mizuhopecten yessoensis]|uniref:Collagen alpha-1(XXI) chain n=1 Tax=Mizuhopecten yessoensis TaxID=6573 RepID=A0A210QB61_MIZYE|nr:uncharacterized protein LOC110456355 [Mizuhopecten yessoensis]XP_021362713.1 uncharacterized protein LOC110456355 [Mizuhopecten yessoensis]OWF45971.1 Collagen alpha-1(XXI) chain [Mizuhopecten yessoensis]
MGINHADVISFGVLVVLSGCGVTLGQNITYVGFNITTAIPNSLSGQKTVLLSGVDLPSGWLIGFLVTTDANCAFFLQLWTRVSPQNHTLIFTTARQSFLTDGQQQVDLGLGNAINLTGSEIMGFTATNLQECVSFNFVTNPLSSTMTYLFSQSPTVGNTYEFVPYQDTNHYGIVAIIQDAQPSTIAYFGFNTTGGDVLLPTGGLIGIMLRDVAPLMFGRLVAFYVNILGNDCQVYFQLWKVVDASTMKYRMKYTTEIQNFTATGYYKVDVSNYLVAATNDRIVFVDVSPTPCVEFEYTSNTTRFSSSSSFVFLSRIASEGTEVVFRLFQRTHRFSVMVEIDGVLPPSATGVTGDRGSQGNTGPEGVTGLLGQTGVAGNFGSIGNTGPLGTVGVQGVTGAAGPVGSTGPAGFKGNIGPQGPVGINGERGVTGIVGPQEAQGPTGVQGSLGTHGSPGGVGDRGEQGAVGSTGLDGLPGSNGVVGLTGLTGQKGPLGDEGERGSLGTVGQNGVVGSTGIQGPAWDPFDVNYCALHTADCDHGCTNSPLGYTCTCRKGYILRSNGNCPDIDECVTKNGGCQYFCQNTAGSYVCSCPQGYMLANDENRCDDINECLVNNGDCFTDQICINTWDGHVCVGPYTATVTGLISTEDMLTPSMFVGLIIWMAVVTFIIILGVITLLPELNRLAHHLEAPPSSPPSVVMEDPSPDYFFPAYFPRVRLGFRDYYSNARSETNEKRLRLN